MTVGDPGEIIEAFEEYEFSEAQNEIEDVSDNFKDVNFDEEDLEPINTVAIQALTLAARQGVSIVVNPDLNDGCAKITVSNEVMSDMLKNGLFR
ncbi:hypothetical protein [Microbulbifer sp. THAF38]|uniref:hypothetical protein n=1 Tax=Microbulbifer sp. THAF38 TaxID=2587856 RepID=UPI00126852E9|nr:hypothetical protein [Microbulbifer sp. THAF38]QFT57086.1 hypothetical protein FIU95_21275 [Microbulbifer sp. THAF38]